MKKLKPRVGLAVMRHPLEEGGELAPKIFAEAARALHGAGMEVIEAPTFIEDAASSVSVGRHFYDHRVPVTVIAVATWSADSNMLDMLEECAVPVVTWALPGMNTGSMCGCQQLGYVLKELGKQYRFVFGPTDDGEVIASIYSYAAAADLAAGLRRARMGLVGYRVPGMTEVAFDELELKAVLGPRTVHYGLETIEARMAETPEAEALAVWKERGAQVEKVSVGESDLIDSMRGYLTLKSLADQDGLSGLAVECYPQFMGRLCLAASLLADEGIVIGCEADMNSTVAMLILANLTGQPVHNTDGLGVDMAEGSIVFSHCGSGSMSLAESPGQIEIGHVRLMHRGACALFPGKPGPVTLVNLVGRRGTYRMGVARGQAVSTGMAFAGNPTKVVLDGGARPYLDTVAAEGLGHHWIIAYGDVCGALQEFCDLLKVPCIHCTPRG
jgi:L-fucose isomerase-like protein